MSFDRTFNGGWDGNVYYHPEKNGFQMIGSLEDPNASYSFDTVVVLLDNETGTVWAAQDSGCSCPTPFEDVNSFADLTPINKLGDLTSFVDSCYVNYPLAERNDLYRKVRLALDGKVFTHNPEGQCYAAAEAIYHMMGGKEVGLTPMQIQHEDVSHWYLRWETNGQIFYIDPTSDQFDTKVPYELGTGRGFQTKGPSKKAQVLLCD